jgi:hypothetical protein
MRRKSSTLSSEKYSSNQVLTQVNTGRYELDT